MLTSIWNFKMCTILGLSFFLFFNLTHVNISIEWCDYNWNMHHINDKANNRKRWLSKRFTTESTFDFWIDWWKWWTILYADEFHSFLKSRVWVWNTMTEDRKIERTLLAYLFVCKLACLFAGLFCLFVFYLSLFLFTYLI